MNWVKVEWIIINNFLRLPPVSEFSAGVTEIYNECKVGFYFYTFRDVLSKIPKDGYSFFNKNRTGKDHKGKKKDYARKN